MSLQRLRAADPAAELNTDPHSARQLLDDILASAPEGRSRRHVPSRRTSRRLAVGGALIGTSAVVAFAATTSSGNPDGLGAAAYKVSTARDGTIKVLLHWGQLSDPTALQAALDRAGARTRVIVQPYDAKQMCSGDGSSGPYSAKAVEWHSPGASKVNALVIRPAYFPPNGTFVVDVVMAPAGNTSMSTFAPDQPQILGMSTFMTTGTPPTSC